MRLLLHQIKTYGVLILVVISVAGCSTQARRVDCDKRLQPINAPTPKPAPAVQPEGGRQ
jgi:hypothetical protein